MVIHTTETFEVAGLKPNSTIDIAFSKINEIIRKTMSIVAGITTILEGTFMFLANHQVIRVSPLPKKC